MNEIDKRRMDKYHDRIMDLTARLGFAMGRVLTSAWQGMYPDADLDRAIKRCDELIEANSDREDQNG